MLSKLASDLKVNRKGPMILLVLVTYRFGNYLYYEFRVPILRSVLNLLYKLMDILFIRIMNQGELPAETRIGYALRLPHGLNGIIISCKAVIGDHVSIYQQVTIGARNDKGEPVIGSHVEIGAGAKVLGPVVIGDHVQIGANAVVVKNVPDYSTAVGIPARNLPGSPVHAVPERQGSVL
ncbi:Serine acetyltransferase [compost metagenome]